MESLTRQGVLIYSQTADHINIRFDVNDYSSELHCGDCLHVMVGGRWKSTRLEMNALNRWYLVGICTNDLNGLRVKIQGKDR